MNRSFYLRSLLLGALTATGCAEQSFTALSSPPPIEVSGAGIEVLTPGQPFMKTLRATGGEGVHTWTLVDGALPPGLTFSSDGSAVAVVSGTPAAPTNQATFSARYAVEDAYANRVEFLLTFYLQFPSSPGPLEIVTTTVADPTEGRAYLNSLVARGGSEAGYMWSVVAGRLPTGLSITSTGTPVALMFGVPTETGTVSSRIRVMDSNGNTDEQDFDIVVQPTNLFVATSTLATACTSSTAPYHAQLEAFGGTGPLSWSIMSGQLPPGLTLSTSGLISGHVAGSGDYPFTVRVDDSAGAFAMRGFTIRVACDVYIVDAILPAATTTALYSHTLEARGGVAPYTWTSSQASSLGLELQASGVLFGVPTRTGTVAFTVRAEDSFGTRASKRLSMRVYGPVEITTSSVATSTVWQPMNYQLGAGGGREPYTWTGWNLPLGYTVRSDGRLVGTATVAGHYLSMVHVRDSLAQTDTATISIHVR